MPTVAVGLRARTGSAVAITLAGAPGALAVLDRRRIDLTPPRAPHAEVYHLAKRRPDPDRFVARAADAAGEKATRALAALAADLARDGRRIGAVGVVLGTARAAASVAQAMRTHAGMHAAEGILYREALLEAATANDLVAVATVEPELFERAAALGLADARATLAELGRALGAPWTREHKLATLAGFVALAGRMGDARRAR